MCECKNKMIFSKDLKECFPLSRFEKFYLKIYDEEYRIWGTSFDWPELLVYRSVLEKNINPICKFKKIMECIIQCDTPVIHQDYLDKYLQKYM